MSGFISKYSGEEIEEILDKADSIEVGMTEDTSAQPFNTITINGVVYKIAGSQQLGLYKHNISFSIHSSSGGDLDNNVSIEDGSNIVNFDVFTTSNTPLTPDNVFNSARTLCFSKIEYDKRTSPKYIYYAIMIAWTSTTLRVLHKSETSSLLDSTKLFYVRDFSDTVVEVVAN